MPASVSNWMQENWPWIAGLLASVGALLKYFHIQSSKQVQDKRTASLQESAQAQQMSGMIWERLKAEMDRMEHRLNQLRSENSVLLQEVERLRREVLEAQKSANHWYSEHQLLRQRVEYLSQQVEDIAANERSHVDRSVLYQAIQRLKETPA